MSHTSLALPAFQSFENDMLEFAFRTIFDPSGSSQNVIRKGVTPRSPVGACHVAQHISLNLPLGSNLIGPRIDRSYNTDSYSYRKL